MALLAGTFLGNIGGWAQRVAAAWTIHDLTGSAAWLGVDAFVAGITTVLLLPLGGTLADRVDRRILLIAGNLALGLIALALACLDWAGALGPWWIVAASGLGGMVVAVVAPASASFLPDLVGERSLSRAIAINSVQFNVARVVGPVAGGSLMSVGGPAWCFAANALSFAVVASVLLLIRAPSRSRGSPGPFLNGVAAALSFARGHRGVAFHLLLILTTAFAAAPMVTMLPVLVASLPSGSASLYGQLMASFGIGACLAGLLAAVHKPPRRVSRYTLIAAVICLSAQALLGWASGEPRNLMSPLTFVLLGAAGMSFVWGMIQAGSALMVETPVELRGRVSSLQQICFRSGQPAGSLLAGAMIGQLTAGMVFVGCAVLGACLLVALLYSPRTRENR